MGEAAFERPELWWSSVGRSAFPATGPQVSPCPPPPGWERGRFNTSSSTGIGNRVAPSTLVSSARHVSLSSPLALGKKGARRHSLPALLSLKEAHGPAQGSGLLRGDEAVTADPPTSVW